MGYSAPAYIFLVAFFAFACGSSEQKTASKNISKKDSLQTTDAKDTLPPVLPPPPASAPAPGTVQIKGKVLSVHPRQDGTDKTIKIKVLKVLKYGSSTPALAPQDTVLVTTSELFGNFKEGREFIIGLSYIEVLARFKETVPRWQLIKIEPKSDRK